mgnify:CR=1 FL=1
MTTRWKTFVAVIRALATHRVTYRFLGLLSFHSVSPKVVASWRALGMSCVW